MHRSANGSIQVWFEYFAFVKNNWRVCTVIVYNLALVKVETNDWIMNQLLCLDLGNDLIFELAFDFAKPIRQFCTKYDKNDTNAHRGNW